MSLQEPVLVGQRIRGVRRLTIKEQSELTPDDIPRRQGPVVIELDNGVLLYAMATWPIRGVTDASVLLMAATPGVATFPVQPSGVEVNG